MVTKEAGIGARTLGWIRQAYCGLHGNDTLMHFEKDRMSLQCASCGHETTGWALSERGPMVSVHAETHVAFRRPRLVSARRIA